MFTISQESNGLDELSKENFSGEYSGQHQTLLVAGIWQTSAAIVTGFFGWLLDLIIAREDIGLGAQGVGVINLGTEIFAIYDEPDPHAGHVYELYKI